MDTDIMKIRITPRITLQYLLSAIVLLTIANVIVNLFKFSTGINYMGGVVPMFSFFNEHNLPTFYSSLQLIFASMILFCIACYDVDTDSYQKMQWYLLSLIFLFLSFDEVTGFHERLSSPVSKMVNKYQGTLNYAGWLLVYIPLVVVFLIVFWRFMCRLPKETCRLYIAAGALFVGGAIGFEVIESVFVFEYTWKIADSFIYFILTTIEEILEMTGIALFIYASLKHLAEIRNVGIVISE